VEKTIRIAYLVSQYPAANHTYILREVRELRNAGIDAVVVSIRPADRPAKAMTAEEKEEWSRTFVVVSAGFWRWAAAHVQTLTKRPAGYLRGLASAVRLAGWKPRRVLFHLFYFGEAVVAGHWMMEQGLEHFHVHFSSTVGLLNTRVFPVSMSITIHGPAEFDDPAGFQMVEKLRAALFVCTISEYGRSQLKKHTPSEEWEKIEVAPLGVDASTFAARPFRENPSPFQILSVGKLTPQKGHHVLIEAIDILLRQGRDVRLGLVGEGPERPHVEREVASRELSQRVTMEGWRNQDEVRAMYAQTDVFALASFAEGVPVVLMEAMAMEIPCVATRITGIPELIRDGTDGLLVEPSDAAQLAEAIGRLMDHPALRLRLGRSARQRVLEKYDLKRNTATLASIFRRRLRSDSAARTQTPD